MVERPDLIFYNQRAAVAQWWSACLKSKASGVRFTPAAHSVSRFFRLILLLWEAKR